MKQESLRLLIRSILQERVEYAVIPGTVQDAGWYAADTAADKRFKEYETLIDLLGVPVTIVFIPGRELPMSANVQTFMAGDDVTPEQFLGHLTRVRADTEEEIEGVYQASDVQRRKIDLQTGQEAIFARAPKLPAGLPKDVYPVVIDLIVQKIKEADPAGLTIIMPERAGVERDADPEWLLHDIGHILGLEDGEFKGIFRPLTRMGPDGIRALSSLRNAGRVAHVGTEESSGVDYGPQALVNMYVNGKGKGVVLAGAERNPGIKRIQNALTREIKRRLDRIRGRVTVW